MNKAGLLLTLLATNASATSAYVTDELVLGVYATQDTQGQRLATLHSGAAVETLSTNGDSTEVRLADGATGWVKTAYLTNIEPATARIKQVQDELDRIRATTPALAEAAERSEVARLTRELAVAQQAAAAAVVQSAARRPATGPGEAPIPVESHTWQWLAALSVTLGAGFWLGHTTLARRIKRKFGGIKVY